MKKVALAILMTGILFLISIFMVTPLISNFGYSSSESSYHLWTHSLLLTMIFTAIFCTLIIVERINDLRQKQVEKTD
ncbi:MAG TPA: hypothetical protein GX523_16740 [Desulfitobacterium dehalogenans]|uniref:Uncharacterized protein n=1 Tax=Desulfitobacterium dehalogenans TaxID=36854 RepID=A0A7C6Z6D4_9FIRM|nr:hypothetical protein [Desulfitobacterium dehalogenans]